MGPLFEPVKRYFPLVLRLVLGAVFLSSGVQKFLNMEAFVQAAQGYHVLTPALTYFYSQVLPWAEILVGVYLLIGLFVRFAAVLTGLQLLSFLVAIGMVLARGETPDCGCYIGGVSEPVGPALVIRDVLFLLAAAYLVWKPRTPFSLDQWLSGSQAETVS